MDDQSPEYQQYVARVSRRIAKASEKKIPTLAIIEGWHRDIYGQVQTVDKPAGKVRQRDPKIPALAIDVGVGIMPGSHFEYVPFEMEFFCQNLKQRIQALDTLFPTLDYADQAEAVIKLAAWAHGEMVRIHPFCDGNGRTSRVMANTIFSRYDFDFQLDGRPRPGGEYGPASRHSMTGDHSKMEEYLTEAFIAQEEARAQSVQN